MGKPGPKKEEPIELYCENSEGICDAEVYGKIINGKYIFTDIRTLVDFEKYKTKFKECDVDFTKTDINAVERCKRYLTAKKFDLDCSLYTRRKYNFKPMMDLYQELWEIKDNKLLNSAETLVSLNQAIRRWKPDEGIYKDQPGRKVVSFEKIEKIEKELTDKELEDFVYNIATIGNFMPVIAVEQKVLNGFNERFDMLLEAIKKYYEEDEKHERFEKNEGIYDWLDWYKGNSDKEGCWKRFVNENYLKGSFVSDKYEVVKYNLKLSQLSDMIYKRSVCMIEKYKEKCEDK